ncbi:MAG: hypothetical protein EA345_12400 [Halomonas sp.]|nr:hypothetical protein [Halomonas sp.]TVP46630.1 MAG: hypothetical protein EA345_12400 [Halomonas sp.]
MPHINFFIKSIAISALTLSLIGQVSANNSAQERSLESGTSAPQTALGTHRHALEIERASNITIRSQELFPTAGASHFHLKAVLLDANSNTVATARNIRGGNIELNYQAQPGAYTLVVNGNTRSAKREGSDQYILEASL